MNTSKRIQINVDVPVEFREVIDEAARKEDRTRNNFIRVAIKEALIRKGYKNKLPKELA